MVETAQQVIPPDAAEYRAIFIPSPGLCSLHVGRLAGQAAPVNSALCPRESEMHRFCRQWIAAIIENHEDLLALALAQRSKFEGWLKMELAAMAVREGCKALQLEVPIVGSNGDRADLGFQYEGKKYVLELKTPNTNWRQNGVENRTRPITKNIKSVIEDTKKLESLPIPGIVAFTLFPIPVNDNRWKSYVKRISEETGIEISEEEHCRIVRVPISGHQGAGILICCYQVSSSRQKTGTTSSCT
jgi:hypothetical protein